MLTPKINLFWVLLVFSLVNVPAASKADTAAGWNYNLTKRCARTPDKSGKNYYQDLQQCGKNAKRHWSLVVQAETQMGRNCVSSGVNTQSYRINGPKSPVTLRWTPHKSQIGTNWSVYQKVDTTHAMACKGQYTFFGFYDDIAHGGGPLPNLMNLRSYHSLAYKHFARGDGEARLTIGAQVFWGGKAHILEIFPSRIGYKANPGFPSGVLQSIHTASVEYVIIDDSWGIKMSPNGATTSVHVDWTDLYYKMIRLKMFSPPGQAETATQSVYVAVETRNKAIASMWQTDFRVSRKN